MQAVARARADIDAGRLWKARDRLRGAFVTARANQEVLDLLGEVLFEMGDLPEAGKYWLLTARCDGRFEAAKNALVERNGGRKGTLAVSLPVRAELEEYPVIVQERLADLRSAAIAELGKNVDLRWGCRSRSAACAAPRSWRTKVGDFLGTAFVASLVMGIFAGVGSLAVHGVRTLISLFN